MMTAQQERKIGYYYLAKVSRIEFVMGEMRTR